MTESAKLPVFAPHCYEESSSCSSEGVTFVRMSDASQDAYNPADPTLLKTSPGKSPIPPRRQWSRLKTSIALTNSLSRAQLRGAEAGSQVKRKQQQQQQRDPFLEQFTNFPMHEMKPIDSGNCTPPTRAQHVANTFAEPRQQTPLLMSDISNLEVSEVHLKSSRIQRSCWPFSQSFTYLVGVVDDDDDYSIDHKRMALLFNPQGTQMLVWLTIVSLAIMYNFWSVIARQAFKEIRVGKEHIWITLDVVADVIYWLDILFQFRTSYLDMGLDVLDCRQLAKNYIHKVDFALDAISPLPLDLVQLKFGWFPLVRFPRFLKFHRAWHWKLMVENLIAFPNFWRVINLVHILLLGCHWFAAFYYLLSEYDEFQSDWGYPAPAKGTELDTFWRKYLQSFYWATLTLTTIGDINEPSASREFAFTTVAYFLGVFIFATIVGQVGNIITNRNATRLEFENNLDKAKNYMRMHNVPPDLQRRVLRWYDYAWSRGRANGIGDVNQIGMLPDKLKTELALHVNLRVLRQVSIFYGCQPDFLHDLVLKMTLLIYTPGDTICRENEVAREMFIIADGVVEVSSVKSGVLGKLHSGQYFGEIGILNLDGVVNRRTATVCAIGYTELFALRKDDVLQSLKDHPEAEANLKKEALERLKDLREREKSSTISVSRIVDQCQQDEAAPISATDPGVNLLSAITAHNPSLPAPVNETFTNLYMNLTETFMKIQRQLNSLSDENKLLKEQNAELQRQVDQMGGIPEENKI